MIPDEKRLTPERVKAAYEATKLQPKTRSWVYFDGIGSGDVGACCGASAVYLAKLPNDPGFRIGAQLLLNLADVGPEVVARAFGLSEDYLNGFTEGFDSNPSDDFDHLARRSADYNLGFGDGIASARAVFGHS